MFFKRFTSVVALIFIFLISVPEIYAQNTLEVSEVVTPEQMVGILIGGGVTTMNITYTGAPISRGKFWGGPGNIGIEDGVILTSGSVNIAPGPNSSGGAGQNVNTSGDPDLGQLAGVSTFDACILEFDFIPQSSMVSFRYVFGSEEYHEYVNSFNDVFGFFISGPGINGPYSNNGINIALVPLSTDPVSINTVNNGTTNQGPCMNCVYFVHNTQNFTQYDAFTTVLTAWATVTPCETYHIKLAIADGSDHALDSGVFLEANSFKSLGIATEISYTQASVDFCIENCCDGIVLFRLSDQADHDMWLPIDIQGTAINGVDYLQIPDSVFFPIGYSTAEVEIIPFDEFTPEWPETVELIYNSSLCDTNLDTALVWIEDYNEMFVETTPDTTINCNTTATVGIVNLGGYEPYTYIWSTGDTTTSITVSPLITTTYYITVLALCDSAATDSVTIYVNGPEANAGIDQSIPYGTPATLEGSASQGSGDYTYAWEPAELLDDPTSPTPTTVLLDLTTIFTLTVTDLAGGCQDADEMVVYITGGPLGANPYADPDEICLGGTTQLFAFPSGGSEDYTFTWTSDPPGFNSDLENPYVSPVENTTYYLSLFDGYNTANAQVEVEVLPLPIPNAGEDESIPYGIYTTLNGSGSNGTGDYVYLWEPVEKLINPYASNPTTVKLYETTIFTLNIVDLITSCEGDEADMVVITVEGGPLNVTAIADDPLICDGAGTHLHAYGGGGDTTGIYTYTWTSDPHMSGFPTNNQDPFVNPIVNTVFTVEVDDGFNTAQHFTQVSVSYAPETNLGQDISACPYDSVVLTANVPGMDYYWSNGSIEESIKVGTTGIGFDIREIWLEITNADDCVGRDDVTITFDFSYCFGINELNSDVTIEIYPNPSNGLFNLTIDGVDGNLQVAVFNIHGQETFSYNTYVREGDVHAKQFDMSASPKGIYFIKVVNDDEVYLGKIMVN